MMKLELIERSILIFLIVILLVGLAAGVYIRSRTPAPVKIEKFDPQIYKDQSGSFFTSDEKTNINYANIYELMKVKGIGKVLALRIIQYRYQNGSFTSIDDIKNVKGLSVAAFEKIKNKITVE